MSSIIFLAETHHCISLYDPHGIIQKLKQEVATYPPALKQSVIQQSLWATEFTLWYAEQSAAKHDMYNIMGCLTRAIKHIVTTLFAMNEIYPMGDKRALDILEKASIKPLELQQQIDAILSADKSTVEKNITLARSLWSHTVSIVK